jgi:hypothetical protein
MIPSIPLVVVTSLAKVFFEGMEHDDTFHTFIHCDLTYDVCIERIVSEVTMNSGMKGIIVLHPFN